MRLLTLILTGFLAVPPLPAAAEDFVLHDGTPVRLRLTSEYRKYHRTHKMMITSWKCRPRNSAGRFSPTESPYQTRPPQLQQIRFSAFAPQLQAPHELPSDFSVLRLHRQ
jgi:hypothetical protein